MGLKRTMTHNAEIIAEHYCRLAAQGICELILPFDSFGKAVNFRQALGRARATMRLLHEGNPLAPYKDFLETEFVLRIPGTDIAPPQKGCDGPISLIIRKPMLSEAIMAALAAQVEGLPPLAPPGADPFAGLKERLMPDKAEDPYLAFVQGKNDEKA